MEVGHAQACSTCTLARPAEVAMPGSKVVLTCMNSTLSTRVTVSSINKAAVAA